VIKAFTDDGEWLEGKEWDQESSIETWFEEESYCWNVGINPPEWGRAIFSPHGNVQDFFLAVDVKVASKSGHDAEMGLQLRKNENDDDYRFHISTDGFFRLTYTNGDDGGEIIEWTEIPGTFDEQGFYRLAVLAEGPSLRLYINDRLVHQITDYNHTDGEVGLFVGSLDAGDVSVELVFENFELRPKPHDG